MVQHSTDNCKGKSWLAWIYTMRIDDAKAGLTNLPALFLRAVDNRKVPGIIELSQQELTSTWWLATSMSSLPILGLQQDPRVGLFAH